MIGHGSEGATALFDMAGFVVCAHVLEDGEWWLLVETTADWVGCPACGVRAVGHGRRPVQVRDLPIASRPVRLVWAKRIWRCAESLCAMGTWSETHEQIAPRVSLSQRARVEICAEGRVQFQIPCSIEPESSRAYLEDADIDTR